MRPHRDRRLDIAAAGELLGEYGQRFKALAVGPGLGRAAETAAAVARLVAEATVPVVIDADAINALADDPAPLDRRSRTGLPMAVITPGTTGEYVCAVVRQ